MDDNTFNTLKALLKDIKPLRISGKDVEWKKAWGKTGVMEKRLISKQNDLPFSLTLKKFPKAKELISEEGYKVHAHPALEIGYIIEGKIKIYFEDSGVKEFQKGDVVVQPAGLKHAAVSADEGTVILAFNIPPADWEES